MQEQMTLFSITPWWPFAPKNSPTPKDYEHWWSIGNQNIKLGISLPQQPPCPLKKHRQRIDVTLQASQQ